MPKSKRLMELLLTVNRRKKFTVKELAEQFGVSSRTILRDLQELSELGVPLYSEVGPHGGYQVLNERVLPPIAFTEGEAVAIFFAGHALRHYASLPFEAETASVLTKFFAYLPGDVKDRIDQMKDRVDFVIPPREQTSPFLRLLLEAAITPKVLRIEYDSRKGMSVRDIQPVGIYASNGFWYCPAYCFLRRDFRRFRVDFIRSVEDAGPGLEARDLRGVHLQNWENRGNGDSERVEIVAELTRTGVRRCQAELLPRPGMDIHADGSGVMRGSIPKSEIPFFAGFFIGLGKEAVVKRPSELVDLIKMQLSEMMAMY